LTRTVFGDTLGARGKILCDGGGADDCGHASGGPAGDGGAGTLGSGL